MLVNEMRNALGLLFAVALVENLLLPGVLIWLPVATASWPPFASLLALAMPRFVTMVLLTSVLGRFREKLSLAIFLVLYAGLLVFRFTRAEVFVNWSSTIAVSRATVPYVAGLLGSLLGFWLTAKRRFQEVHVQ
jgi:hypothetical protein